MEINKYMVKAKGKAFDEKLNNEWIYGYYTIDSYSNHEILDAKFNCACFTGIYPDTICRPTMLLDKNGNMIWENDVVRTKHNEIKIVKCFSQYARWGLSSNAEEDKMPMLLTKFERLEVLGNIYDNPELLQTEDDLKEIIEGD